MKIAEFSPEKIVERWASLRGKVPFTSAQCFDQVKDIDEMKSVSDALVRLYKKGLVARRKLDGVRYEYVWHTFATNEFEQHEAAAPKKAASKQVKKTEAPKEQTVEAPVIPEFLRKSAPADHFRDATKMVSDQEQTPSPPAVGGGEGVNHACKTSDFDSEAIADALLAKLKPLLNRQRLEMATDIAPVVHSALASAHLDREDALDGQPSRITIRIEKLEISVEGVL